MCIVVKSLNQANTLQLLEHLDDRYDRYIRSRSGLICATTDTALKQRIPKLDFTFEKTKVQDLFPPDSTMPSVVEIENQFSEFFDLLFEEMLHCRNV